MATITQDLGSVSAYALAVEGGYTGTEAQYKTLMANIGNTAQEIEDTIDNFVDVTVPAQVALVTAEGTEQIGLVEAEGTEQIGLVDAAGDAVIASIPADYTTLTNTVTDLSSQISHVAVYDTASGDIASFEDGADDMAITSLVATIEPVQDTSGGDPSPDNVCPITGWSSMNVTRTGKSLFETTVTSGTSSSGITRTVADDGTLTISGSSTGLELCIVGTVTLPAATYVLSGMTTNSFSVTLQARLNDASGTTIATDSGSGATFTLAEETIVAVIIRVPSGATLSSTITISPMIRLSSETSTTYEEYSGNTVTIDLGGTRYGGTLDVISGVLTVNWVAVDMGSLSWTYDSTYTRFVAGIPNMLTGTVRTIEFICSCYATQIGGTITANVTNGVIYNGGSEHQVYAHNLNYTDAATFTTAMTGQTLVYQLETATTVQLTANQVNTLLGDNNIFCDTGSIASVEYPCDTKLYIAKAIAAALA